MEIHAPTTPSMREILDIIFKHKAQILLFFLSVVVVVAVGTFLIKPNYEASAQILVKMGRDSVYVPATGDRGAIINNNQVERINSEIEILKSRSLAEKIVLEVGATVLYEDLKDTEPGIIDDLRNRIEGRFFPEKKKELTPEQRRALNLSIATSSLQENLGVEALKNSNIIQITFKHSDPRMVAMVVNNLAKIYLDRHLEVHKKPESNKFFQEQSEISRNKLHQAEDNLKTIKEQHNITSLDQERTLLLGQASGLRAELNKTISQEVETEKRIYQLRQQLAETPDTIAQGEEINRNEDLIGVLETRLVELELEKKELLAKYTDQSRLVQNVNEEIQIVRKNLAVQEEKSYGNKRSGVNPTYQKLQQQLFENEAELNAIKAKSQIQAAQLADYQGKLEQLNQIDVKLNQLQQQIDVERQNYKLYLTKFEESRIYDAMDSEKISSVSLLEPASIPLKPVSPNIKLNLLLAAALGAFGGLALALFREYLDDSLKRPEDVEAYLGLPVLASIPVLKRQLVQLV